MVRLLDIRHLVALALVAFKSSVSSGVPGLNYSAVMTADAILTRQSILTPVSIRRSIRTVRPHPHYKISRVSYC
jgi:hypothetical protein